MTFNGLTLLADAVVFAFVCLTLCSSLSTGGTAHDT